MWLNLIFKFVLLGLGDYFKQAPHDKETHVSLQSCKPNTVA